MSQEVNRVRPATQDDVQQIAPLFDAYRQFYEQTSDLAQAQTFIAARLHHGEAQILLVEQHGMAIGFCQLYPSFCSILAAPIFILSDLFVLPTVRKSGAGRALLLAAEDLALAQGKVRLDLTTAKTNFTAQALYESLGWQRDEVYFAYTRQPQAQGKLCDAGQGASIE